MPPIFSKPESRAAANATQETYTPSFDVFLLDEKDVDAVTKNPYINKLSNDSTDACVGGSANKILRGTDFQMCTNTEGVKMPFRQENVMTQKHDLCSLHNWYLKS